MPEAPLGPPGPLGEATKSRETFGSRFGSLMALIGVAVGLANVWRFPYLAGKHGGAAFVLLYIVLNVLLGVPAIMAEWTLGRLTRQGPAGAFVTAGLPGGRGIGVLLFFTVFMALSYYTMIAGQVLFYALYMPFGGTLGGDAGAFYQSTLGGITLWNAAMTATTFFAIGGVVYLGVRRGIEAVSRVAMPLVFVTLLLVIARSVTLPGGMEGIRFYLVPDFSKIDGPAVLAAMGQVFFSLSLGGTFFLLYGSYLREDENIPVTALQTTVGDVGSALLAGLAVFPAVFAMGVEPTSGPSLLFISSPSLRQDVRRRSRRRPVFRHVLRGCFFWGSRRYGSSGGRRSTLFRLEPGTFARHLHRRGSSIRASVDGQFERPLVERPGLGLDDAARGERSHPHRPRVVRESGTGARRSEPREQRSRRWALDFLDPLGNPDLGRRHSRLRMVDPDPR